MEKNEEILINENQRKELMDKVEILDKVGNLLLLGNTEFATTQQVTDYYEVELEAIKSIMKRHKEELTFNGLKVFQGEELKALKGEVQNEPSIKFTSKLTLFSKRAILNVGMLLRDSEVAKELRSRLLDIIHDAEEVVTDNGTTIVENVVEEILDEKAIILEKVEAEMKGDYATVSVCNAKLFALKNRRISELEENIKVITNHSLTITESKSVINRLVRVIAQVKYSGQYKFAQCWQDIWTKVNYQLGINIQARVPKNSTKSKLTFLTEEETFKMEEIIRTYANSLGVDVQSKLELN